MTLLPWILIIIGAAVAYGLAAAIKKKEFDSEEKKIKYFYIVKTIGFWLVIIGAFFIFKENGSFGIK